jgi:hypothetical protein
MPGLSGKGYSIRELRPDLFQHLTDIVEVDELLLVWWRTIRLELLTKKTGRW